MKLGMGGRQDCNWCRGRPRRARAPHRASLTARLPPPVPSRRGSAPHADGGVPAGTIVSDVVDAKTNSLVLRGTALSEIPKDPNDYAADPRQGDEDRWALSFDPAVSLSASGC